MLSTAADPDGFPPSQVNQGGLKDFVDIRAESQLADISHTPNEQMGFGPRHTPSRVCLNADDPFPPARGEGEPDFPWHSDANPGTRVVHFVHGREDTAWTETQLSAIVRSTGENSTIIEEEYGVELSARDINNARASQDRTASTHRRHRKWSFDDLSVSAHVDVNTGVNTGLATQVQAPTPDISIRINRE